MRPALCLPVVPVMMVPAMPTVPAVIPPGLLNERTGAGRRFRGLDRGCRLANAGPGSRLGKIYADRKAGDGACRKSQFAREMHSKILPLAVGGWIRQRRLCAFLGLNAAVEKCAKPSLDAPLRNERIIDKL